MPVVLFLSQAQTGRIYEANRHLKIIDRLTYLAMNVTTFFEVTPVLWLVFTYIKGKSATSVLITASRFIKYLPS
jgi:hypothetical protein